MTCHRSSQRPANPCECICQVTFNLGISLECTRPHCICRTICRIESSPPSMGLLWHFRPLEDTYQFLPTSELCVHCTHFYSFSEVLEGGPFLMISLPTQHSTPHTAELKKTQWTTENIWPPPPIFAQGHYMHACFIFNLQHCRIYVWTASPKSPKLNCLRWQFYCPLESKMISGYFNNKLVDIGGMKPPFSWRKSCFYFPLHRRVWLSGLEVEYALLLVTL